jgi:thymidylate kinase
MFIVVEGTDASGKTSLISAVENEVKRSRRHLAASTIAALTAIQEAKPCT